MQCGPAPSDHHRFDRDLPCSMQVEEFNRESGKVVGGILQRNESSPFSSEIGLAYSAKLLTDMSQRCSGASAAIAMHHRPTKPPPEATWPSSEMSGKVCRRKPTGVIPLPCRLTPLESSHVTFATLRNSRLCLARAWRS